MPSSLQLQFTEYDCAKFRVKSIFLSRFTQKGSLCALPGHDHTKIPGADSLNNIKTENNGLKKSRIKNRTFYYFDNMIEIEDFNFDNILLDENSYENISVYYISYKTLIGAKPLRIRFDKVDGFIRIYDGTRYLVLFGPERCDTNLQQEQIS